MNPARTLAHRFRTQRTDRIRVDGNEVLSIVEFMVDQPVVIEVVVTECRDDATEALVVSSEEFPLQLTRTVPECSAAHMPENVHELTIAAVSSSVTEMILDVTDDAVIRIWNAWLVDGARHAWVGNSGMILEDLDTPPDAIRQFRVWSSDGFGNPTFDDLVAIVTIAALPDGGIVPLTDEEE